MRRDFHVQALITGVLAANFTTENKHTFFLFHCELGSENWPQLATRHAFEMHTCVSFKLSA